MAVTEERPIEVGLVVEVSCNTDDEELNEFLMEHGNQVRITSIEDENCWGEVFTKNGYMYLPYHFEMRDIVGFW